VVVCITSHQSEGTSMQTFTRLLFAVLITLVPLSAAGHQIPCGIRTIIVEKLERAYGETQRSIGNVGNAITEVWASDRCVEHLGETFCHSWTILLSAPNGASCILQSGQWYQEQNPPPSAPGSPTGNEAIPPK